MAAVAETPWVIHNGSGTRGPFELSVGGVPISYLAKSQIVVRRYDSDGDATVLTEGTHYTLSADAVVHPQTAASVTLALTQAVLAVDEKIEIERVTSKAQTQSFTAAGGFSSASTERTLDQAVRMIQELYALIGRAVLLDPLDTRNFVLPPAADRTYGTGGINVLGFDQSTGALEVTAIPLGGSSGVGLTDGDKGDVVVTAAGLTWTLVAAQVLAKLLTVDGAASGLDADKLDGLHATSFQLNEGFDVTRYGAACDARTVFDAACTNGSTALTSATAAFTSADVGKKVLITRARTDNGSSYRPHVTTIASVTNATTAVMTDAATRTVSSAELIIGTDDTTAFQAAINAADANGGGFVDFDGHAIISSTLTFNCDFVKIRSNGGRMSTSQNSFASNLALALANTPSRIIWAGADSGVMLDFDVGQLANGTWVKHQGNGLEGVILDGMGRAGYIWRSFSQCALQMEDWTGARFTLVGFDMGVTTNANFIATADGGSGSVTDVASGHNEIREFTVINNGANIFGAKGFRLWGDRIRGNVNDTVIENFQSTMADAGPFENISIECADTCDIYGAWNGQLICHANDTGVRSLFNSVLPGTELLTTASAPASEIVTLEAGFYTAVTGTGGGSMTITAGTGTATSLPTGLASSSSDTFEVTARGTFNVSETGTLNTWSVKMDNRACQARSITIDGDGRFLVKKSALGAGNHAQNIRIRAVMENNLELPQTEPGADAFVEVDAQEDQSVGAMAWGKRFAGVQLALAATQSIPDATWTSISWPTPVQDGIDLWASGSPTRVTVGSASVAHEANNVKELRFDALVNFVANSTGYRTARILKNGTDAFYVGSFAAVGGGQDTVFGASLILPCAPGDYFELQVFQSSGGALNMAATSTRLAVEAA